MLIKDILGQEINIGDECIMPDGGYAYKIKILKESDLGMQYTIWDISEGRYLDKKWWCRKASRPFNNMYKI